jgi:outer membrane protein OmpA-like peptidoglycan-associated protein
MENVIRRDTVGKVDEVDAKYELLKRGQYTMGADAGSRRAVVLDSKTPLELYEARNAVQIARWADADKYAADTFRKAEDLLRRAEDYQARNAGRRPVVMTAREAVQAAEDSRLIAIQRAEEERLANERQAAAEREARAKAAAEAEAQRRAAAEAARAAAEADRASAERAKHEADAAAAEARRLRAEADQARSAAEAAKAEALAQQRALAGEAERARLRAADADRLRQEAEAEKAKLRQDLLNQLNMILETRDSARGLIVNMSDVLFDFNKYTLRPGAREKLAKISGIVLAHPGLKLEVEGHTDSVGSDEYNQKLSDNRADSVRSYLVSQGVKSESIAARGFGESRPVADNNNAAGRQQNRRVELVVSGDIIGTQIESSRVR